MNKSVAVVALVTLILGLAGGWFFARTLGEPAAPVQTAAAERKPLYYRHPMNPEITSPVPAKDAMGMDYIPVYADEADGSGLPAGTVRIDPQLVQTIGVRTARVEQRTLGRVIRTVGRVAFDEERLYRLHPKIEGWIEELRVDTTGQPVRRGDILLSIYSPKLVSTQQEYLLALKNLEALANSAIPDIARGARELVAASRERLRLLDVPEHQLRQLEETRQVIRELHIHAPATGIVMQVGVREGQFVTPRDELYLVADLSRIWVLVDIYEDELPWVRAGDPAEMSVMAVPGRRFRGKLSYIYPYAERQTRTIKARLEFDNTDGLLKPDMFADVTLHASQRRGALAVPEEAIIRSGVREKVFVVRAPGQFEPREVTTGVSSDDYVEILEGLEPGDEVVVSAQFLIDSESKLREAAAKMRKPANRQQEASHDHAVD